jgi:malonyl CoA-acyl carrier protein transacylase
MHFVLSGEEEGVKQAITLALARKAISASRLPFNTALHSPTLLSSKEEIQNILKEIEIQPPKFPILNQCKAFILCSIPKAFVLSTNNAEHMLAWVLLSDVLNI